MANIEIEMRTVIEELQLNLTVKEFFSKLRDDPANFFGWDVAFNALDNTLIFRSGEEVFSAFNTTINDKILAKLPMLFKRIPSQKLELVEESVRKGKNLEMKLIFFRIRRHQQRPTLLVKFLSFCITMHYGKVVT